MPNIKPLSDLRMYSSVLEEVTPGSPVFLTKNGRGRYAIVDIRDYEKYRAEQTLLSELEYGRRVAEEKGALSTDDVRAAFSTRFGQATA